VLCKSESHGKTRVLGVRRRMFNLESEDAISSFNVFFYQFNIYTHFLGRKLHAIAVNFIFHQASSLGQQPR